MQEVFAGFAVRNMNKNCDVKNNLWLHWFAVLAAAATFLLLGAGGLVTSHGAGMSVPDWPNSYGYNMFLFPPSKWVGGIFYEHTHRLWASAVGLMTTILAVWIWLKDSRRWMKWLGVAAFLLVVLQGVLGGLRVVLIDADLGIVHGIVGQTFFVLMCALALVHQPLLAGNFRTETSRCPARPAKFGFGDNRFNFLPAHSRRDHAAASTRAWRFPISRSPTAKSGRTPAPPPFSVTTPTSSNVRNPSPRFKSFYRWFIGSSR